jgi:hypothetical protein
MKSTMPLQEAVVAMIQGEKSVVVLGSDSQRFRDALHASGSAADHSCGVVVVSSNRGENQEQLLREAAHMLHDHGRVILIDGSDKQSVVHTVEHQGWTVHDSAEVDGRTLLALTRSDESVQS